MPILSTPRGTSDDLKSLYEISVTGEDRADHEQARDLHHHEPQVLGEPVQLVELQDRPRSLPVKLRFKKGSGGWEIEKSDPAILVKAEISLGPKCRRLIETDTRLIQRNNSERQVPNSFPDSLRDFESSLSSSS